MCVEKFIVFCILAFKVSQSETKTFFGAQKKSYALYAPLNVSDLPVIEFKLKTAEQDSLLLYIDDHLKSRGNGNYLKLKLSRGRIELVLHISYPVDGNAFNIHSQSRRRHLGVHLNDNHNHVVKVEIQTKGVVFTVDGEPRVISVKENDVIYLNSPVYIGGVPLLQRTYANHHVIYDNHFTGCITNMRLQYLNKEFSGGETLKAIKEHGTARGCQNMCAYHNATRCLHGGRCFNKYYTTSCDCRGTGYHGKLCELESPSISLSGKDYLSWEPKEPISDRFGEVIVRFRAARSSGVIFYVYGDDAKKEFMLLEIFGDALLFTYKLSGFSSETLQLGTKESLRSNSKYLHIYRHGNSISLKLDDGESQRHYTKTGSRKKIEEKKNGNLNIKNIFIGGIPPAQIKQVSKSKTRFTGCIEDLFINQIDFMERLNTEQYAHTIGRYGNVVKGCKNYQFIEDESVTTNDVSSFIGKVEKTPITTIDANDKIKQSEDFPSKINSSSQNTTWLIVGICVAIVAVCFAVVVAGRYYYMRSSKNQQYRSEYMRQNREDAMSFLPSKSIKADAANSSTTARLMNSESNRMQTFSPDRKVFYASPDEIMAKRQSSEESL